MKIRAPVKEYDPIHIEKRVNDFWVRTYAYTRDKNSRAKQKKYYFVDGPPFTAGSINLGLARNKILKDAHIRFIKSQGFNVLDRPGFDMHGLPIEVKVEESLGLKYKNQIEELGIEKFVKNCMEFADAHRNTMTEQFRSLGIWLDWQNPYLTADSKYIESVWWSLKEAHKKKYLQRQKQVTGWCPRCESPLTPGEISYTPTEGHSVYFKIPIKGKRDEYIIVWTTAPWTFAGCLAVAVNPDLTYARVAIRQGGKKSTIIVLENRVEEVASASGIDAYEIIDTVQGKSLENLGFFHPLMADIQFHKSVEGKWCHKIIALDSVHDSHTGCVHISPGLGIADAEIGEKYSLPVFSPVDERGVFTTEVGMKYAGQNTEEANASILADMKALRFVLSSSRQEHKYGHCWRCDSPVINRVTEQWFLKSENIREVMLKIVKGASWTPDTFGIRRQQEWISKGHDWCISRQRFWGTPLPIWECIADICGHIEAVGSVRELVGANGYQEGMDLHRPWIDAVSLECPKCGGLMKRVPDIVDVWFDSSAASWAQLGYPRKKAQFKEMWPADWISESQDQSKGWFHNQIFAGAILFGKIPFRKVLAHGQISGDSSSGISDISAATDIFGTDALRLYMLSLDPTENITFKIENLKKSQSVLKILWNCYVFSASYMNMDSWDPRENQFSKVKAVLRQEDIWLISRAESLTHAVRKEMDAMRTHIACKQIEEFIVEDLSRWYVKLSRERMWKEGLTPDKEAAFTVQREIFKRLSVIMSPLVPYMAETLYQEMDGNLLSVTMVPWPESDGARLAEGMERSMNRARDIVRTVQKFRQELGLGLRWPIGKMTISAKDQACADSVITFKDIIKSQSNVKELELVPENQEWAGQELIVVPNRNVIGKAYKQRLSKIARMLKVLPAKEIKEKVEAGEYELGIEGEMIKILPEMVRFETKLPEGIESKEFSGGTLYFDTKITDELMAEGFAREIIRRIQQMRKEAGLDPEEYINLRIKMDDGLLDLLDKWLENIADSTRATQMEVVDEVSEEEYIVEWPIQEETVVIGITSLNIRKAMSEFLAQKDVDNELALAMVEAGILSSKDFLLADREEVLKIPGMSHSKYRKLKEYLELPEEKRKLVDSVCPLCNGYVEQGSTSCQRCGKDLISDEELAVEIIKDIEAEEEPEYVQEPVRERVRVGKKQQQPGEQIGPEDEIVKMASDESEKSDDDEITSEILSSISEDEPKAASEPDYKPQRTQPATEQLPAPQKEAFEPDEPQPEEEPVQDKLLEDMLSSKERSRVPTTEPETMQRKPEPEQRDTAPKSVADESFYIQTTPPVQTAPQPSKPSKETEGREPDESDIEDTFQRELEGPEVFVSEDKSEIIDEERDIAISRIAETFDIKNSAAKTLYNHGYTTVDSFSTVTEEELRDIKGIGKITARRIVQKASRNETKMCSLCNAIVPVGSLVCTRCGVKFAMGDAAKSKEEQLSALEELDKKLIAKPSDSALLYAKAQTLRDAGKDEEALEVVDQALATLPDEPRLRELKQELEDEIGEPEGHTSRQAVTPQRVSKEVPTATKEQEKYEEKPMPRERPDISGKETLSVPEEPWAEPSKPEEQYTRAKPAVIPEPISRSRPPIEDESIVSPEELESETDTFEPETIPAHEAEEAETLESEKVPTAQKTDVSVHVHMHDRTVEETEQRQPEEAKRAAPEAKQTEPYGHARGMPEEERTRQAPRDAEEHDTRPGDGMNVVIPSTEKPSERDAEEGRRPYGAGRVEMKGDVIPLDKPQARQAKSRQEEYPEKVPPPARPYSVASELEETPPSAKHQVVAEEQEPEEAPARVRPRTAATEEESDEISFHARPSEAVREAESEEISYPTGHRDTVRDAEPEDTTPSVKPMVVKKEPEPEGGPYPARTREATMEEEQETVLPSAKPKAVAKEPESMEIPSSARPRDAEMEEIPGEKPQPIERDEVQTPKPVERAPSPEKHRAKEETEPSEAPSKPEDKYAREETHEPSRKSREEEPMRKHAPVKYDAEEDETPKVMDTTGHERLEEKQSLKHHDRPFEPDASERKAVPKDNAFSGNKEPQAQVQEHFVLQQQVTDVRHERSVDVIKETRHIESQPARQHDAYQPRPPEPLEARSAEVIRDTRYSESISEQPQQAKETKSIEEQRADVLVMPASEHVQRTEAIVVVKEPLSIIHEEPKETQALQDAARASESVPEEAGTGAEEPISEDIQPEDEISEEIIHEEAISEEIQPEDEISEEIIQEGAIPEEIQPEEEAIPEVVQPEEAVEESPPAEVAHTVTAQPETSTLKNMVSEMVPTKEEEDLEGAYQNGDIKLKSSFTYLIPEERSARSYQLFKKAISEGMPGYCVTRTFPEKVRDRYELGAIPILWLSNVAKEDAVRPKDLEKLSLSLEEFLGVEGGIILLDGIEYLITNNNFITVLKLIQSLRDQVAINRSILLLSINPSTMDSHQINLLKREVDSVIE